MAKAQNPDDPICRYGALPISRSGHFHLTRNPGRSRKALPIPNAITPTIGQPCVRPDAMRPLAIAGTLTIGQSAVPMKPTTNQSSLLESDLGTTRQGAQRNKTRRMTTPSGSQSQPSDPETHCRSKGNALPAPCTDDGSPRPLTKRHYIYHITAPPPGTHKTYTALHFRHTTDLSVGVSLQVPPRALTTGSGLHSRRPPGTTTPGRWTQPEPTRRTRPERSTSCLGPRSPWVNPETLAPSEGIEKLIPATWLLPDLRPSDDHGDRRRWSE